MTDAFDDLDSITLARAGDPISYTPYGGQPLPINGWVDHSDDAVQFGITAGVTCNASVEVRKIDVAQPTRLDTIYSARTGKTYRPVKIDPDKSGRWWIILLAYVGAP